METPSDQAYKHIIPLDFNSVKSVPDSFVWLQSDVVQSDDGLSVPVIDLMDSNAPKLIVEACETWGIFQLKSHGIPTKIIEDIESEARKLFDLPIDQKLKAVRSPDGVSGYGIVPMQSLFSTFMWHEGLTILGSAIDQAKVLWPDDYKQFCDTIDDYKSQMTALAEKLMRILFKALSIPAEEFNWFDDPNNSSGCNLALQLNSYPPCPEPTRTLGLAPHTDTSIVTILRAKTSGLQVFKDRVGWIQVKPEPDALIVNLGDFVRILSNDRFISVLHRVVVKPIQRYSIGYFFRPPMDFVMSPLMSKDLGPGKAPRYRSIIVKEYLALKAKHLEKTFSLIENLVMATRPTPPDQEAYMHVIPLDFASVKTLPDSFVWPESYEVYSGIHQPSIPVIDLMDPNATELIIQACETWGVFQLTGHRIPKQLVENVESEAYMLFALPAGQKLKTLRTPGGPSTGYGNPPSQALLPRKLWHEGFTIMGSPVERAKVLWPHDYQGFCDTMDDYQKEVKTLVDQLIRIIFKFLSISEEEVNWFDDPTTMCNAALQLNSYPPCPDPTRAVGLAPHSDSSLFTILHSRTEGLQIFKEGVGWIIVQPNPDALIVNLGDFLHILSNGRFVSVLHRAAVNQKYHRISVAYLCWPPMDFTVTPILSKALADSGQAPKYRPVTLKEYRGLKAKHFQEAISIVKT
ncbi:uncharacterized protein LOC126784231 [Argentina anserina]|uniref:uncharacterized protein LOC126784231 n=1 Tax=Argentina anserina TaxID=57926 RepID=UPI002176791F|nr:uncharacterized protein LOC126784231 [Potentilla anserina]